jgi:hypothetical protein
MSFDYVTWLIWAVGCLVWVVWAYFSIKEFVVILKNYKFNLHKDTAENKDYK